ncbi:MAG: hypothetical protein ACR2OY_09720 [Boseongicola sp.]
MSEDWYRNTEWSDKTREAFFAKLKRSRSQRDQYLAIQALTLAPHEPDAALDLATLYFDTRTDDFDDNRVRLAQARAFSAAGRLDDAADTFRQAALADAANPTFKTNSAVEYARFVVENALTHRYREVALWMGDIEAVFLLPREGYLWHGIHAAISADDNNPSEAQRHAGLALDYAARTKSSIPNHPALGLIAAHERETEFYRQVEGLLAKQDAKKKGPE